MKTLVAIAIVIVSIAFLLAGCASTSYSGITTGSRCYDAEYASKAGLNQAETAACEAEGRKVYWANVSSTAFGNINCASAGKTFERCVDGKRIGKRTEAAK